MSSAASGRHPSSELIPARVGKGKDREYHERKHKEYCSASSRSPSSMSPAPGVLSSYPKSRVFDDFGIREREVADSPQISPADHRRTYENPIRHHGSGNNDNNYCGFHLLVLSRCTLLFVLVQKFKVRACLCLSNPLSSASHPTGPRPSLAPSPPSRTPTRTPYHLTISTTLSIIAFTACLTMASTNASNQQFVDVYRVATMQADTHSTWDLQEVWPKVVKYARKKNVTGALWAQIR
jgi:hypothetical protein